MNLLLLTLSCFLSVSVIVGVELSISVPNHPLHTLALILTASTSTTLTTVPIVTYPPMLGSTTLESRKFVDLLFRSNGLYASFEPSIPVYPGDFGVVDRATGSFLKEGNIFDDSFRPYIVQADRVAKNNANASSGGVLALVRQVLMEEQGKA